LLDGVADSADIFHDNVGMVRLPGLSRGRVVLLGDAGYCPTFLSGMGASLALLGARALDQTLRESPAVAAALARYDALMLPVIAHYQETARKNVDLVLSDNPVRTVLQEWAMRLLPPALVVRSLGHQHDLEAGLLSGFGTL